MYNIEFEPYVGKNYQNEEFKVLVLGESHHCSEGNNCCFRNNKISRCNSFTTNVIEKRFLSYKTRQARFERWMNTYSRFSNIFAGNKLNNNQIIEFWNKIIFYNYVQYPMELPRQSPSNDNFTKSQLAFEKILTKFKPNIIILWGDRMWNNFPKNNVEKDNLDKNIIYKYKINNDSYPIITIPHPSSSKLSYEYSKIINEKIDLIKKYYS